MRAYAGAPKEVTLHARQRKSFFFEKKTKKLLLIWVVVWFWRLRQNPR
jgi:hypothetical protein